MRHALHLASFVALGLGMALPAAAVAPFSFDAAAGRLPKNVVPIDYTVSIVPDVKALTIAGRETVQLQFRATTATIQFNSLDETLSEVRLDGKPVKQVVSDNDAQLTTVTLAAPAPVGRHTLTFHYAGKIGKQPVGLFAQDYLDQKGAAGVLLSTQMEATDARRMFPCWDEPAFRATFGLTVTVRADWAVISNMPASKRVVHGHMATTTFARSPKMPSYLVEFSAGDFAQISGESDGTRLGVWAVRGQEQDGKAALANTRQILADYNDYFGYRFPLPKLDSIAIPGGFAGAMENWGAITYNERLLLLSPASTVGESQEAYSTQAHEMAHQWNGDLVTMGWWDDIWLNESFASFVAARETALRNPDWHWWLGQDADKERAMGADARATSHAIQQHVTDELQATNAFDPLITYSKGQAILRMFEAYLGPDVFRSGVRALMQSHAFSNATTADLWNALGRAGNRDVGAIAAGWTEQAGFPLVTVASECDAAGARTLRLSQQRFVLGSKAAPATRWSVPLQVRSGAHGVPQGVLLTQDGQGVAAGRCDEPLSVNADAIGYYRARYEPATLATNTTQFAQLPDGDRVALLDDQWALAESGGAPLPSYLALATALGNDLLPRAWEQVIGALNTIEYAERGTPGHEAFTARARAIIRPAFEALGWDARPGEAPNVRQLRRQLIGDLGAWGDPAVIAEARKRFDTFIADHKALAPDDQEVILAIVAQSADAATYEQILALARGARDASEVQRYFGALAHVRDPALAARTAQIALSDAIPPQADTLRMMLVRELAREHQRLSWDTLTAHHEQLLKSQAAYAPLILSQYIPQVYWSGIPLIEIETWVKAQVPAEMAPVIARGMESAQFRLDEKTLLVREADAAP